MSNYKHDDSISRNSNQIIKIHTALIPIYYSISKVKSSLNLTGSAPPQPKISRPTKKSPEAASFINQKTFDEPYITASDLKIQIKQSMDVSISNSTLNNFRGEIGFKYLPPEHSPLLSDLQI